MNSLGAMVGVGTAVSTLALAVSSFVTIRRTSAAEGRRHTPLVTFDFYDAGVHENLGAPGFRCLEELREYPHLNHTALRLSGKLRNISASPAIDCQLDIYVDWQPEPVHEIRNIRLHDGMSAADTVEIVRLITLEDVDTRGEPYFQVGIHGLFAQFPVSLGQEYPFAVVFSYKNAFGAPYFSVYKMRLYVRSDKGLRKEPVLAMVFKGSSAGTFTGAWFGAGAGGSGQTPGRGIRAYLGKGRAARSVRGVTGGGG
ncbi:MAG: hypothetical protein M0Z85_02415 [Gammaproteobacteria bacterium]|nr:hypothetical protein [Gammaproteobacteria bacterium]